MGVGIKNRIKTTGRLRARYIKPFRKGYYLFASSSDRKVYQYYLGDFTDPYTELDLTNIKLVSVLDLGSNIYEPLHAIAVGNNGTKLYLGFSKNSGTNSTIHREYDMATQQVNSATLVNTITRTTYETDSMYGLDIKPDGTVLYTGHIKSGSKKIVQETLSPPWSTSGLPTFYGSGSSMVYNRFLWSRPAGTKFYWIAPDGTTYIRVDNASVAWDVSSLSFYKAKDMSNDFFTLGRGWVFEDNKTMILVGDPIDNAYPEGLYVARMSSPYRVDLLTVDWANRFALTSGLRWELFVEYITP